MIEPSGGGTAGGGTVAGEDAGTVTWRELLAGAAARLAVAGMPSPGIDARRIVEQASGREGAAHQLALDEPATVGEVVALDAMVARRAKGEPLQYVVGRWAFRTLDLLVDRRVLIPRPETEMVVEHALAELDRQAGRPPVTVVDLGTGSGAIALSIAAERLLAAVWAVEVSPDAVAVARANLAGLGRAAARVSVSEGSWFEPLPADLCGAIDLVVSNPPYVAAGDELPPEVAGWEPTGALVAGPTGLEAIERIVTDVRRWLAPHGALVVEIGDTQAGAAASLARAAGFAETEIRPDLTGRPRALIARR